MKDKYQDEEKESPTHAKSNAGMSTGIGYILKSGNHLSWDFKL